MSCKHQWTLHPPNQHNLYKCLNCGAIGVMNTRTQRVGAYKCMRRGCIRDAVTTVDGARYCAEHAREAKAK